MAKRVAPSRHQADNPAGNFMSAACNDWPDVRRFHVGTDHSESTPDAGYTTACASPLAKTIDQFPCFLGESIYDGLEIVVDISVSGFYEIFDETNYFFQFVAFD